MNIVNARLRRREGWFTLVLDDGIIKAITPQAAMLAPHEGDLDAQEIGRAHV